MKFTKMHGIGNDYIYINFMETDSPITKEEIIAMSDRHKGIGSDGVIFICPSKVADVRMRMFNADGSEAQMCGNGIRCVGKYVYDHNIVHKKRIQVETKAGIKQLDLILDEDGYVDTVLVDMGKPCLKCEDIPVISDSPKVVDKQVVINNQSYNITCVSMGNPHCIVYVEDVDSIDLEQLGPCFENDSMFPERINTEFIEVVGERELKMRVWERGSGETLACGTGACASVVASFYNGIVKQDEEVIVHLLGGDLFITYTSNGNVKMRGSATEVFTGEINLQRIKK